VPVNFRLLHDQKRDPIYVAAAGVVTNLGLALLSGLIFRVLTAFDPALMIEAMMHGGGPAADTPARMVTVPLSLMCLVSVQFNCLLALFNLIPIPPLDGGRIAVGLLPPRASMALASVERYGTIIVLLLLMFGPAGVIWRFVDILASFILGA
jgi:Zn-dependent protease